jgi:hypothetical protein
MKIKLIFTDDTVREIKTCERYDISIKEIFVDSAKTFYGVLHFVEYSQDKKDMVHWVEIDMRVLKSMEFVRS